MGLRRKGREFSIQTLYALGFVEANPEFTQYSLLNEYPEHFAQLLKSEKVQQGSALAAFAEELVKNVIINLEEIHEQIAKHIENWSLESMDPLDRCILQVSVYELMFTDTPTPVVINEAVEISKKYCSESSWKFLNGILDAVNREVRQEA